MAGVNQVFACQVLELRGFESVPAGSPGAGATFPITKEAIDRLAKLVAKAVVVDDGGGSQLV